MLDPRQDASSRDALAQEARGQIAASGTLKHENTWGLRKLAFEIGQCNEADYRWFRFEAPTDLLESLDHNLKIADGVLRFRIFKVDPSAPVMVPPATPVAPSSSRDRGEDDGRGAPEAAEAAVAAPEPTSEAPAEDAGEGSAEASE